MMLHAPPDSHLRGRPPAGHRRRRAALLAVLLTLVVPAVVACSAETSEDPVAGPPASVTGLRLVTPGVLTVGTDLHHPPLDYRSSGGEPTGLSVDLAKVMASRLGLTARFVDDGFGHLLPDLQAGRFDVVISHHFLADRLTQVVTAIPYLGGGISLVVPTNGPFQPAQLDQLCGHRVAVQADTYEAAALQDAGLLCAGRPPVAVATATDPEALAAVQAGRAEAQLTDRMAAGWESSQATVMVSSGILAAPDLVMLARRDAARIDLAMIEAFALIRSSGTYEYIIERAWQISGVEL
jgi:polar amino acid transport system substrate-binding protein